MPSLTLTDEQAHEARCAIEAEIARTNEALSLPFVQALPELHGRGANSVRLLAEILGLLTAEAAGVGPSNHH